MILSHTEISQISQRQVASPLLTPPLFMEGVPEGLRVPCTESTMKQLSQTRYMEPVSDWRYDALYHGSPERFRLMRETVEWIIEQWK